MYNQVSRTHSINEILWEPTTHDIWRSLSSVESTATYSYVGWRVNERLNKLMPLIISPDVKDKIERLLQLGKYRKCGKIKYSASKNFLDSIIAIVAAQINPGFDQYLNLELNDLRSYIEESYKYPIPDTMDSQKRERLSIKQFIRHTMQQVTKYLFFKTIKPKPILLAKNLERGKGLITGSTQFAHDVRSPQTPFEAQRQVVGSQNWAHVQRTQCMVSGFLNSHILQAGITDNHGVVFMNYMELSHRVKTALVIGVLERNIIQDPTDTKGVKQKKMKEILYLSKYRTEVFQIFSPKHYWKAYIDDYIKVKLDPFTGYNLGPEETSKINKYIYEHKFMASDDSISIAHKIINWFNTKHSKKKVLPHELIKYLTWSKFIHDEIDNHPEKDAIIQIVGDAVEFTAQLVQKNPYFRTIMSRILQSVPRHLKHGATLQEIQNCMQNAIMYFVFLKELSLILSKILMETTSEENLLFTHSRCMNYYWSLSKPTMPTSHTGKRFNSNLARSFEVGKDYLTYLQCSEEFEKMMKIIHHNPESHTQQAGHDIGFRQAHNLETNKSFFAPNSLADDNDSIVNHPRHHRFLSSPLHSSGCSSNDSRYHFLGYAESLQNSNKQKYSPKYGVLQESWSNDFRKGKLALKEKPLLEKIDRHITTRGTETPIADISDIDLNLNLATNKYTDHSHPKIPININPHMLQTFNSNSHQINALYQHFPNERNKRKANNIPQTCPAAHPSKLQQDVKKQKL